jgi:archaeal type IV pilus assembly protein PilA
MNSANKATRRWRKKGPRGVSPIIATILLVAITVVLAAVLYILISGLTKGPGNTPIGSAFALGTINEASAGTNYYYNTTVQSASTSMTWSDMIFQIQNSGGGVVTTGPTTITVTNSAGSCNVATYTFSTAAWTVPATHCASGTTGGSALIGAGGAGVDFLSSVNFDAAGYSLVVVGQSVYSGTATFAIP